MFNFLNDYSVFIAHSLSDTGQLAILYIILLLLFSVHSIS